MAKSKATDALDFLAKPEKVPIAPVCAVYGDEAFLKREVLSAVRKSVAGDDGEFGYTSFTGKDTEWKDVRDALSTISLFGNRSTLVILEEADAFVSGHRSELESYVAKPLPGMLVLEVKTWPGNTRLAKVVAEHGTAIECKQPSEAKTKRWLTSWAKKQFGKPVEPAAADALWELLPHEIGILQQEVHKLAMLCADEEHVTQDLVEQNVGGWRSRTVWEMVDLIMIGNAPAALVQLDRLIAAGEQPIGLLAQAAGSLRRVATAASLFQNAEAQGKRMSLRNALERAGVKPFKLGETERQMRQIGRERALQIPEWLLSADLAMKSHNSSPARARIELEQLIGKLSQTASKQ